MMLREITTFDGEAPGWIKVLEGLSGIPDLAYYLAPYSRPTLEYDDQIIITRDVMARLSRSYPETIFAFYQYERKQSEVEYWQDGKYKGYMQEVCFMPPSELDWIEEE